ncbi:pullulanase [Bacillus luteolus]|uniref:Pullulanase n=1 Tax=Litchfieldia luteola TaxID=682179 RepID=A0ABR9QNZ5_9BACI|nr:DUF6509 family protein [Cytobacillus luteolus]MBE4910223.1 pullulanase [Cytobacillus luteolus]MBP1942207.1 hypothetical protein [Cytobacillus luteolus]
MIITDHTVEKLEDPFGLLAGDRYEFLLNIEVSDDDELYSDNGIYIRLIFVAENENARITQSNFIEKETNRYLEFELEEDEEEMVLNYCKNNLPQE